MVEGTAETPRPYLEVRDGLRALIGRNVYYRLADLAEETADGWWLTSAGTRFRFS
jgi:hypothetical protein